MTTLVPGMTTIPDDLLLGHIAWYTITKPLVTHEQLAEYADDLNLSKSIVPQAPRLGDAFKRACRFSERNKIPVPGTTNMANFMIRKVAQTRDEIERHVVMEIVDSEDRTLDHIEVAALKFDRKNSVLNVKKHNLRTVMDDAVSETLDMFSAKFDEASKYIDPQVLRRMIREQLEIMHATAIRRQGSVYFVPIGAKERMEGLEQLCERLSHGSVFNAVPLPNTGKQREMVRNAFEKEVHEEASVLVTELNEFRVKETAITPSAWERYLVAFRRLKASYEEYGDLVKMELTKANVEIEALESGIGAMLTNGLVKDYSNT